MMKALRSAPPAARKNAVMTIQTHSGGRVLVVAAKIALRTIVRPGWSEGPAKVTEEEKEIDLDTIRPRCRSGE